MKKRREDLNRSSFVIVIFVFAVLNIIFPLSSVKAAVPNITGITPDTGTTSSTTDVTITGTNFEAGARGSLLNGGPFIAGSYNTPSFSMDVVILGNYAYVADGPSGLQIADKRPADNTTADFCS